ncbi:MAG: hypothetical protein KC589_02825 [Nanoarchaeota archaeon]|nr:hypothetical protein [Nanoarchaeota archaeon]
MSKNKITVEHYQNGINILHGKPIFKLMDTHGIPLDIINEILRRKSSAFNIADFIIAAKESKNYSKIRITKLLTENSPLDVENNKEYFEDLKMLIDKIYSN